MPAQANSTQDPISKITKANNGLEACSRDREPALQVWSPEFKPQSYQKTKQTKTRYIDQWNSLELNPFIYNQLIFNKDAKNIGQSL
jgi:hypothetical protein